MSQKKRVIPVLFIKNGLVVRSEGFKKFQIIGNVIHEASRYNQWNVDELIYIDISRDKIYDTRRDDLFVKSFNSIFEIVHAIAKVCFMPLTFGGGIRTIDDVHLLIRNGADKVLLNTAAYDSPELIRNIAHIYGAQSIVVSVDYRIQDKQAYLFTHYGQINTGITVQDYVKRCEDLGVGELMLHAIERDGSGSGFDCEMIYDIIEKTKLPIIACGGAGSDDDFVDILSIPNISAVAAGNIFHFTERSYPRIKHMLKQENINVR